MEIVVPLEDTLGKILSFYHHQEIPCGLYVDYNTTRRYPGIIQRFQQHQEIRGDNMEIVVPLRDILGIIWILQYHQETPWELFGDCSTTRRYLETTGDCSTTKRYHKDYMEIVSPLGDTRDIVVQPGDTVVIIWRLK